MSIRRKGSRSITVDRVEYRWRIRKRATYDQQVFGGGLTLAVELADEPGCSLLVGLDSAHPNNLTGEPFDSITPSIVAENIRFALAHGWQSAEDGPKFWLHLHMPQDPSRTT